MTAATALADHLRARLGSNADAPADLIARLSTASHTVPYAAVAAPADADGVAAALSVCAEEGWPVRAIGAATWLSPRTSLPLAPEPPVLISTVRLRRVVEHEPADLVVGVEAGLPLAELRQHLDLHGQLLPLDPPAAPEATIGAVAGLGSAGPLRAGHGTVRDMALGLRIATGDGRLLRFGGRVVKNVAGYDGVRLAVGSGGSIGIITEVYLRVRGAPRSDRTVVIGCGRDAGASSRAADLALAVRDTLWCDALELVSPALARELGLPAPEWSLLIRLLGSEPATAEGIERVERIAKSSGREAAGVPVDVWRTLGAAEAAGGAVVRLTGSTASLAEGLEAARDLAGDLDDDWCCAAHAADGAIRLWRSAWPVAFRYDPAIRGWTARYAGLPDGVAAAPPPRQAAIQELTQRVKRVFDPAGILQGGGWQ